MTSHRAVRATNHSSNVAGLNEKLRSAGGIEGSFHLPRSHPRTLGVSRSPETPREKFKDETEGGERRRGGGREERAKADAVVKEEQAAERLDVGGVRRSEVRIFHLYPV